MVEKTHGNEISDSVKRSIRPEALGGESDKGVRPLTDDTGVGAKRAAAQSAATERLRDSENAAQGGLYKPENGLDGTRKEEREPRTTGYYFGKPSSKSKMKGRGGKFKKGGPFIAIILAIFGFGGVMMGTQAFQPFSLVAQFQEKFNSMHVSTNLRSARFIKWQMSDITDGYVKDPIKSNIFGSKLHITSRQQAKLEAQGISYDKSTKTMEFTDSDGITHKVTADNFDEFYVNNAEFHQAYNAGSKTWRGQFANWFGATVINFITNNKLTRNMFEDFRQRVDESPGKSSLDVFKEIMNEKIAAGDTSGKVKGEEPEHELEKVCDNEGNCTWEWKKNAEGEWVYKQDSDGNLILHEGETDVGSKELKSLKTESEVKTKLDAIAAKFQTGANVTCAVFQFFGTVTAIVAATEALQIINMATAAFETVDKVKAGYGDEAPIHELTNALNTRVENTNNVLTGQGSGDVVETGSVGSLSYSTTSTTNKTAMESAGVAAIYSNGEVNASDPSVNSFNISNSVNRILGGMAATGASFATCTVAKATAAVVSMAMDAAEIAGCVAGLIGSVFTFGAAAAACGPLLASVGRKIAWSVAIGAALAAVISLITPLVTTALTRDLVSNLGGEDFGNALTSGANMYQGNAHKSAGGSLATPEKYTAYLVEQQAVIADNARYERESLSPFDMTSKYTFMGSLMNQLTAFATSSGTLMNTIKTGGSVLSNSLIAMSPTATAYNIADVLPDMDEYQDTCPYLASIGAVGDAFCNPYMMTDTTTMDNEPTDVIKQVEDDLEDELTEDGNVIVKDGSDLAKYIVYCDNRGSQFGITDYNIANSIGNFAELNTSISAVNTVGNSAIGAIPVFGDLIDIVNDTKQLANAGYISGETCVAGNTSKYDATPSWNEAKNYQRFIEDQALAESMGLIEESAATAYYERYLEEHPLDNSYAGIIARKAGVDTDTVAFVFDLLWYAEYIENYDPSERYAFGGPDVVLPEEPTNLESENVLASWMPATENIVYADVRNRNYTV